MKKSVKFRYLMGIICLLTMQAELYAMNRTSQSMPAASRVGIDGGGVSDDDRFALSEPLVIEMQEVERITLKAQLDKILSKENKHRLKGFSDAMVEQVLTSLQRDASYQAFMEIEEPDCFEHDSECKEEEEHGQRHAQGIFQDEKNKKRAEQKFMIKLMADLATAQKEAANSEERTLARISNRTLLYFSLAFAQFLYFVTVPPLIIAGRHETCP